MVQLTSQMVVSETVAWCFHHFQSRLVSSFGQILKMHLSRMSLWVLYPIHPETGSLTFYDVALKEALPFVR